MMDESMNSVKLGGHLLSLNISHGTSVNQSLTQFYLWPNVFVLTISTLVNLKAAMVIGKQERTRINQLIIWDCFANIFTMCVYVFDQSPWQAMGLDVPCVIYWSFEGKHSSSKVQNTISCDAIISLYFTKRCCYLEWSLKRILLVSERSVNLFRKHGKHMCQNCLNGEHWFVFPQFNFASSSASLPHGIV